MQNSPALHPSSKAQGNHCNHNASCTKTCWCLHPQNRKDNICTFHLLQTQQESSFQDLRATSHGNTCWSPSCLYFWKPLFQSLVTIMASLTHTHSTDSIFSSSDLQEVMTILSAWYLCLAGHLASRLQEERIFSILLLPNFSNQFFPPFTLMKK